MAPNEEDVQMFMDVMGGAVDRATAIQFIDGNAGDMDRAMNDYFNNPDRFSQGYQAGWDDSHFTADRDGGSANVAAGIPSFSIDAGADQGIGGTSAAPTRPPSRRSNYSTNSGQQESGTINSLGQDTTGRQYFGPMTRDAASYAPEQWAMVPVSSAARVYENPGPEDRVRNRENGEPVCFKPLKEKDPLPSLIAVLGQIPRARKELLCEQLQLDRYGSNGRWWGGEDAHAGEASVVDEGLAPHDVAVESQRLMAFTQESNRSYGSVEQLERLEGLSNDTASQIINNGMNLNLTGDLRFLVGWSKAAEMYGGAESQNLFKSVVKARENVNGSASEDSTTVYRLELEMGASEPKQTMYLAIDRLLWGNDRNGDSEDEYFLEQVASVFVIRVKNRHTNDDARGLGLQVPPSFCADRYLQANVGVTKQMRKERAALREELGSISERKAALDKVPHPKDPEKLLDRAELFDKTVQFLRGRDKPVVEKKKPSAQADGDEAMQDSPLHTRWDDLADELEKYHAKIQDKLKDLDDQRTKIEQHMANLTNILTENAVHDDTSEAQPQLQAQYALRGIGIGPAYETTFVYVDPAPTTDPTAMDADGQWWRFEYPSHDTWSNPTKRTVTEDEVIAEASNDANEALLIYAERRACDTRDPGNATPVLWPALRSFVDKDNEVFDAELQEARRAQQLQPGDGWPGSTTTHDAADDYTQQPALPLRTQHPDQPPAYDDATTNAQHIEHVDYIPDPEVEVAEEDSWVPDPGPNIVPDTEYVGNVNFEGGGRGVSTMMGAGASGGRGRSEGWGESGRDVDAYGRKERSYAHW